MEKKCLGCNMIFESSDCLDPKQELDDECYIGLDEWEDSTKNFVIDAHILIKIKHTSSNEIYQYLKDVLTYTTDIDSFSLKIKRKQNNL